MNGLNLDPEFERGYRERIASDADGIMGQDIEEEGAWEDAVRSEVNRYGWYTSTNQAYNTLLASNHQNDLMERIGYEDMDILELVGRAAAYAIEGDIVEALGGDFEEYRLKCDERFGRDGEREPDIYDDFPMSLEYNDNDPRDDEVAREEAAMEREAFGDM